MSKRNFTLLIIILVIVLMGVLGFLFFKKTPVDNGGEGTNFLSRFNPFGISKPANPGNTDNTIDISGDTPGTTGETEAPVKLHKISSVPVAGFEIFKKERLKEIPVVVPETTSSTTPANISAPATTKTKTTKPTPPATEFALATRYVDRATGNIFQTFLDKVEERRFSTTTIPKIYEAYFGNKDNSVLMRYLKTDNKTINTFVGTIPKEVLGADTASNEIKGVFLPDDVTDLSFSPDASKAFYLLNVNDSAIGTILNLADNKKTQVFDSAFSEWLSYWPTSIMITLTTKPSAVVTGHMYTLNTATKSFIRVLGDIYGLTTLTSPSGKTVLYGDNNLSLNVYDIAKKTSTAVGVLTMPEKCTWGSASDVLYCAVPTNLTAGQYPDTWYQGEVSFTDQIWKIDLKTGATTMLVDPVTVRGGEEIDGIKLSLSSDGKYLLFVNKKDSFLWKLDLN